MELLLYLFGNGCVSAAGLMLLLHSNKLAMLMDLIKVHTQQGQSQQGGSNVQSKQLMISRDLQILITIGTYSRIYWSCSSPPVWTDEELFVQILCWIDLASSCILWSAICGTIAIKQTKFVEVPPYFSWPVLTGVSLVLGYIGAHFLPTENDPNAWPLADTAIMFNMIIDAFAMVPQMYTIANSSEPAGPELSHFVGLLCVGRVFRMLFWGTLLFQYFLRGSTGHYLWTFIIPDIIHTAIMFDYLLIWLKKVKQDKLDPMLKQWNMEQYV